MTKEDVEAAIAGNGGAAPAAPAPPAAPAGASTAPIRGPAATLARFMDESRSIPTATSFRTLAVDELAGRRAQLKAAGKKLSFTHLIAWAIVRATDDMPVMANSFTEVDGKPHRVTPEAVSLGLAVDVERKDGTRSLVVPGDPQRLRRSTSPTSWPPTTRRWSARATTRCSPTPTPARRSR